MGHNHNHQGHSHHSHDSTGNIIVAFWLNLAFACLELVGGAYINSVAIMSDALHDLGDSFSLGLAYFLQKKSEKKRDEVFTYGYQRYSLLAALITSVILLIGSVTILTEAFSRLGNPEQPNTEGMMVLAVLGILVNTVAMYRLKKGNTLNEQAVSLHFLEDVLGWVAVLIGAVIMRFYNVPILDPILSIGIALFILYNVYKNIRSVIKIFLQAIPENVSEVELKIALKNISEIVEIHDVRCWSLDGNHHVVTFHALLEENKSLNELEEIKFKIRNELNKLEVSHTTIEFEFVKCNLDEV